ncbi:hypothetical protein PHLGIDRAFT_123540, partial [Phlebiopsis gigantea 11061_1 CR5-6]
MSLRKMRPHYADTQGASTREGACQHNQTLFVGVSTQLSAYEDQTPVDNKLYPQPVLPAHVLAEDVSSILDDDPDLPALEEIIAFDDELVDFEEDKHDEDQEPAQPPPHSHEDQTMQDENQEPTPPPPPPPMKLPRAMRRQLAKARAKAAKHGKPDKIVLYVHFKSHFDYIEAVLKLHGIDHVHVLHGGHTVTQRAKTLKSFRESTQPAVLVMSQVGIAGLNLDCASILIIVDVLWSALEDRQLQGRLNRRPQSKQVIVYRLIAWATPDVILNNISFTKEKMMAAFEMAGPELSKVIAAANGVSDSEIKEAEEDSAALDAGTLSGDEAEGSKPKRKMRAKAEPKPKAAKRKAAPKP